MTEDAEDFMGAFSLVSLFKVLGGAESHSEEMPIKQ